MVLPPVQVCVIGADAHADDLERAALARYAVNKSVIRLRSILHQPQARADLPPALAETLPHLPTVEGSFAVLCSGFSCQPPISSVDELMQAMNAAV
jgi:uncharacterized protein YyaL (SSP411 family)